MNFDVVSFVYGEWRVYLDGVLLPHVWNSKGAARAGCEVEKRRLIRRQLK